MPEMSCKCKSNQLNPILWYTSSYSSRGGYAVRSWKFYRTWLRCTIIQLKYCDLLIINWDISYVRDMFKCGDCTKKSHSFVY